ncbi:hypothetical protein QOT17_012347 [Balamuthia mandrillaris]
MDQDPAEQPSWELLPPEVWAHAISLCPIKERVLLSNVSRFFSEMVNTQSLWQQAFRQMRTKKVALFRPPLPVAASPQSQEEREGEEIDWKLVCRTMKEYDNLSDAVRECEGGEKIYVAPGCYTDVRLCCWRSVEIIGEGKEPSEVKLEGKDTVIMSHCERVSLRNLQVHATNNGNFGTIDLLSQYIRVEGCDVSGQWALVCRYPFTQVEVIGCRLHDCISGINFQEDPPSQQQQQPQTEAEGGEEKKDKMVEELEKRQIVVRNCRIWACEKWGIKVGNYLREEDDTNNNEEALTTENKNQSRWRMRRLRPRLQAEISHCHISNCQRTCIYFYEGCTVLLDSNDISKSQHSGIGFYAGCDGVISNNKIYENRYYGIANELSSDDAEKHQEGGAKQQRKIQVKRNKIYSFQSTCLGGYPCFDVVTYGEDKNEFHEQEQVDPVCKKAISNGLCTFAETGEKFYCQYWWNCKTCNWGDGYGVCYTCKEICHKGHDIEARKGASTAARTLPDEANFGLFFW